MPSPVLDAEDLAKSKTKGPFSYGTFLTVWRGRQLRHKKTYQEEKLYENK